MAIAPRRVDVVAFKLFVVYFLHSVRSEMTNVNIILTPLRVNSVTFSLSLGSDVSVELI